jgi:anaerobic magnesium-protoporphyrin IX monomethyl ester cyclase
LKVAIVQRMPYELFGVTHVSSIIKRGGHRCEAFIADWDAKRLLKNIRLYAPDLLAFTLASSDYGWFKQCVSEMRRDKLDMPIMVGGPHATFFPELIEENDVDFVFRGEAEDSLEEFLYSYGDMDKRRSLKGIWAKGEDGTVFKNDLRQLREDLDALPFPDRSIYYDKYSALKARAEKRFFTSRGCPYECAFCHNTALLQLYKGKGKYVRRFSRERVIREIQAVRDRYVLKIVTFVDDLFCQDIDWLRGFLKIYKKEIGLPFKCYVRADMMTEELVRILKESGLYSIAFGVESGDEKIRMDILNKRVKDADLARCALLLHKWGIRFTTFNIFGTPTETVEDAFKTVEFNIRIKADFPWASILSPYPMTEITRLAKKLNLLPDDFSFSKLPSSYFHVSPLELPDKYVFENIQKIFYFAVRYPWTFPFFKKLVKIKSPHFFNALFYLSSILRYSKERNLPFHEAAGIYWQARKSY